MKNFLHDLWIGVLFVTGLGFLLHEINPVRFRWYRRLRGGVWYLVAPWPALPEIDPFWCRDVMSIERVLGVESYEERKS